jgi:ribonuclease HII
VKYLIGIDEVGRGPLAGPVSIGIAVVPVSFDFSVFVKLNDSKKMTERGREECAKRAEELRNEGQLQFGIFSAESALIDDMGIEHCISFAIRDGLSKLVPNPDGIKIFLDGRLRAPKEYEQETVIRGDEKIPVISLASVVAKVERDRCMTEILHPQFPEYGFDSHKGYGTATHIKAIQEYGPTEMHRRSFLSRILPSIKKVVTV